MDCIIVMKYRTNYCRKFRHKRESNTRTHSHIGGNGVASKSGRFTTSKPFVLQKRLFSVKGHNNFRNFKKPKVIERGLVNHFLK